MDPSTGLVSARSWIVPATTSRADHLSLGVERRRYPSTVSLRRIESAQVRVLALHSGEELDRFERRRAMFELFEGAVYLNQNQTYLVKDLDMDAGEVTVELIKVRLGEL